MSWGFKERRKFPRARFTCKIVVSLSPHSVIAQTKNISAGGIRISMAEMVNPADIIDLELFLKKDNPIRCKGRVVWATEVMNPMENIASMYDVGIEFLDISDQDREYIKNMVEALLVDQKDAP